MPCYTTRIKPASKKEYESWKKIGYIGTYDDYSKSKRNDCVGQVMFICGELGNHCADCSGFSDFLCDYPVGKGRTCDRDMCEDHASQVGLDIHYCKSHNMMWEKFRESGGVDDALRNVIAFKPAN